MTTGVEYGMHGEGGTHGRIKIEYRVLDIENIIRFKLMKRKGRSVILCKNLIANPPMK